MSRIEQLKEAKLPLAITASVLVGTAAVLSQGDQVRQQIVDQPQPVANDRNLESHSNNREVLPSPALSQEEIMAEVRSNLVETLGWMSTYPNEEVRQSAQDLARTQIKVLSSGSKPALISYSPEDHSLSIGIPQNGFRESQLSLYERALYLFEADYMLDEAKKDPKRYISDKKYRDSLQIKAAQEAIEAFTNNDRPNPASSV